MYRKLFLLVTLVVLWILVQDGTAFGAGGSLIGRWMCDEGQGSVVSDSSGNKRNGKFVGGDPAWTTGVVGSAVKLVGPTLVEIPAINMTLTQATMAGWFLPNGAQADWASIIMHRGSGAAHGFNMLADRRLAYHWNDASNTWSYRGDAYYSATEWTHCAVTVEPSKATFYVNGVSASVNNVNHTPANWNQVIHLGGDDPAAWAGRQMNGALDDVMFFSRALNAEQVAGLMKGTIPVFAKAENPTPANGSTGVAASMLQWTPGETAVFVEIYVGTTPDLTAANKVKRQSATIKMLYQTAPPLEPGQKYYWRVDALDAKSKLVATGDVWSFTMAPVTAFAPIPADGAIYQSADTDLAWTAGQNAFSHEVYFSTNQDDVANRAAAAFQGSLVEATLGLPPLTLETTYYWCVDEIDALGDKQVGKVWSFTTTIPGLGKAKRELWLNGSTGTTVADLTNDARYPGAPTDVNEMPDFESPANIADNYGGKLSAWLHVPLAGEYTFWVASDDSSQLFLGADADSAEMIASVDGWTNAQEWDKFGSQKSRVITLEAGRYFLMALWKDGGGGDNCAAAWQGAGIPSRTLITGNYLMPFEALWAYGPRPRNGAVDTTQTLELKWTAGTRAATHQIYFSDDPNAVADGTASRGQQALDSTTFNPGVLEFGKTYYWRVDEVNPAESASPWKGAVWSFTTANFIVIDDFEDYVDDVVGRIFQTWIDGWGYSEPAPGNPGNGTGSAVGYANAPFAEKTIVKSGLQSMPLAYNNADSPYYSETDRTFNSPQNWTINGMNTLSLQVRGYPQPTSTAVTETGGKMTLTGDGADIWNNSDEFTYAYKSLSGDGTIIARVVSNGTGTNTWAKGGVMIRDSLDGGSMHANMVITGGGGNGASFQYRNATDGTSGNADHTIAVAPPYWVKIERFGDSFAGYVSADGATWVNVGTQDVIMAAPVYIGICVTSHVAGVDRTFQFDSIKTTGGVSGQWQGAVIASPKYNSAQDLYVAIQDSANKTAVVKNATAVNAADWVEVQMPLSSFTGVNMTKVKKMTIGVGSRTSPAADGSGMLFIDDIRVIKP